MTKKPFRKRKGKSFSMNLKKLYSMYQKISGHENQIGPQSLLIFPNTVREAAPFRQKLTVSQQFLFWKHLVHLFQFTWNQC